MKPVCYKILKRRDRFGVFDGEGGFLIGFDDLKTAVDFVVLLQGGSLTAIEKIRLDEALKGRDKPRKRGDGE